MSAYYQPSWSISLVGLQVNQGTNILETPKGIDSAAHGCLKFASVLAHCLVCKCSAKEYNLSCLSTTL